MSIYDQAQQADLEAAIIIGKDRTGRIQLFVEDADRERMIVLLERAKNQLVKTMDG